MPETGTSVSTTINCSAEDAFNLMADVGRHKEIYGAVKEIKDYAGGPFALGDSWVSVTRFMGQDFNTTWTVAEYDAPRKFTLESTSSAGDATWPWTFVDVEGGVKVSCNSSGETKGFLAALAAPMVRSGLQKQLTEDLERIKDILEG